MKINTEKDIENLDKKINEEYGIDLKKYRNEEIAENFVELLIFPQYVINWVIRPIGIALLIFMLGYYTLNLTSVEYIIYTILGSILFLITGFVFGLLFLIHKMKKDIWGVIDYSLDILKSLISDLNYVKLNSGKTKNTEVLQTLFKGIIYVVTIPMISNILAKKIPLIGELIGGFVRKVLILIAHKTKFSEVKVETNDLSTNETDISIQKYLDIIHTSSNNLEKGMRVTFGIAKFPIKIIFLISLAFLILFLIIIN